MKKLINYHLPQTIGTQTSLPLNQECYISCSAKMCKFLAWFIYPNFYILPGFLE